MTISNFTVQYYPVKRIPFPYNENGKSPSHNHAIKISCVMYYVYCWIWPMLPDAAQLSSFIIYVRCIQLHSCAVSGCSLDWLQQAFSRRYGNCTTSFAVWSPKNTTGSSNWGKSTSRFVGYVVLECLRTLRLVADDKRLVFWCISKKFRIVVQT